TPVGSTITSSVGTSSSARSSEGNSSEVNSSEMNSSGVNSSDMSGSESSSPGAASSSVSSVFATAPAPDMSPNPSLPLKGTPNYLLASDISRFLTQATFGPTPKEILR